MKYDYAFFQSHAECRRKLECPTIDYVSCAIDSLYRSEPSVDGRYDAVFEPADIFEPTPSIIRCNGAYFKGGQSVQPLEASLKTKLPEDFVQFYEQFGESVIITRSEPIMIHPLKQMIDDFEDDPDIEIGEGRFFRFARYQDPLYLGLRRDDQTDDWQVVICTYGLLYSEMISQQGRGNVVAPSFYAWLKHLIETDGYPDKIYPRDGNVPYLTVLEE